MNAKDVIKALLGAVSYCHEKGIVHRDLKPQNIMLEEDLDGSKMKLIDFGTAKIYDKSGRKTLSELMGSPYYIAPEVLKGKYGSKVDVWGIGIITFLLLSGELPFKANAMPGLWLKIKNVF
jgi:calcium-dependent protein kinase